MTPVRFSDEVETIPSGEEETIDKIIAAMRGGGEITRKRYGRAVRTSHAKAHGLLRGELHIHENLGPELAQGIAAQPRSYPAIVRLSHVPGEFLDDRRVSTPRGMSLKIFDVDGPMLPGHAGARTQDFVLDTGKVFNVCTAEGFLAAITATEAATPMPEGVKAFVSHASRLTNAALHAVGLDSANLDFYGHPFNHPLGEGYFSQMPLRWGDFFGKLGIWPDTERMRKLADGTFAPKDENGLRTATQEFFWQNSGEWVVGVQLCTDLAAMPVEDASRAWPEDESPYRVVGRLVVPVQEAYGPERADFVEEDLSFCPAHSLAAHRPLGSVARARMKAYRVLGTERRQANGRPVQEPDSIAEMPG